MRKIRAALMVLAVALGITFVAATPAHAAWEGCPTNAVCTYLHANGGTPVYYYTGPIGTCIDIGYPYDENISSVWNRMLFHKVQFYQINDTCSGGLYVVVGPNRKRDYGPDWYTNDSFNSMKIVRA